VPAFDSQTVALISRPHVVEVLAALNEHRHTLISLRRTCRASRRSITRALRALTTAGAVRRRGTAGRWDTPDSHDTSYQLTGTGHRLVDKLFDIDGWTATYQQQSHPSRHGS